MKKIFSVSLIITCTIVLAISCKTRDRTVYPSHDVDEYPNITPPDNITIIKNQDDKFNLGLYIKKTSLESKLSTIEESGYTYEVTSLDDSDPNCKGTTKKYVTSFNKTSLTDRLELTPIVLNTNCSKGYKIQVELLCKTSTAPQACYEGTFTVDSKILGSGIKTALEQLNVTITNHPVDIVITPTIE